MNKDISPTEIEKKWQARWDKAGVYKIDLRKAKNKYYTHVMFPYPSGDKLHIGHWYNYSPADSFARFKRMQGYDVFSPMGFDAFGLPAENYAIKTGVPPAESTNNNVTTMIKQLKRIGCMYDWGKSVNTSQPEYYKWTQWIFLQMYKNGLAYKKEATVNYCPQCKTVLANEQVWEGRCERCESEVVQKPLNQWYWKVSTYAQRLLDGLNHLNWPEKTKLMQQHWIGKSTGISFKEKIKDLDIEIEVFDTVPQTFMAQTFTVIAPEHPLVPRLVKGTKYEKEVLALVDRVKKKKAANRFNIETDMEGAFTGRYINNPFGTGDLELWVASFVVADYGTGIVNCSAHDERDFLFAKKYGIPLKTVMVPEDPKEAAKVKNLEYCYFKEPKGVIQQPEELKGRYWSDVREDIMDYIEKKSFGTRKTQFKLRDWCISRQRYWGAPIPIVYDPEGNSHPIPDEHLPWELPTDIDFTPDGTAPLARSKEFKKRTEKLFGKGWVPEADTMDTFVCSSFYSLMYLSQEDRSAGDQRLIDPKLEKKWLPVDTYIGGSEHACMHLIYARFVSMAMKDFGIISHEEQYQRLVHQGFITNKGAKMSKSKGNVVSPDGFVEKYGSDVFRMYLMFMGPFTQGGDWSDTGIKGTSRFYLRILRVMTKKLNKKLAQDNPEVTAILHKTIKKVTQDIERMHFNTALAALMECMNLFDKQTGVTVSTIQIFAKILAPLAPHLAEEIWEFTSGKGFVIEQKWPEYDESMLTTDILTIAVQVNGKVRGEIEVDVNTTKEEIITKAKKEDNVKKYLEGNIVKKEIYVPGKLVSFVV